MIINNYQNWITVAKFRVQRKSSFLSSLSWPTRDMPQIKTEVAANKIKLLQIKNLAANKIKLLQIE